MGLSPSPDLPPGLVVLTDFVTEEEERGFLSALDWGSSPGGEYHYMLDTRISPNVILDTRLSPNIMLDTRISPNIMLDTRMLKTVLNAYLVYIDIFAILLIPYKFNGSISFCDFAVFVSNC